MRVADLFAKYCPDLVPCLDNTQSDIWKRIADNSITNRELVAYFRLNEELGRITSKVYRAEKELLLLRANGDLPTP
jgi:hypothetical protein